MAQRMADLHDHFARLTILWPPGRNPDENGQQRAVVHVSIIRGWPAVALGNCASFWQGQCNKSWGPLQTHTVLLGVFYIQILNGLLCCGSRWIAAASCHLQSTEHLVCS